MGSSNINIHETNLQVDNLLRSHGLIVTRPRRVVLTYLMKLIKPIDALTLYNNLSGHKLSLSTIYRTLATFTEASLIDATMSFEGVRMYQVIGEHKHLLRCSQCDQAVPLDVCPLERFSKDLEQQTGYVITGHNLEFIGLCPTCASSQANHSTES